LGLRKSEVLCVLIFLVLTLISLWQIFGNSLQDSKTSNNRSETIVENVKPIIDPEDKVPDSVLNKIIRKLAHGIEFAILGFSVCGLYITLIKRNRMSGISTLLLFLMSTAVIDEFIQSFTGRTSSVKDVLIDFAGGVIGICISAAAYFLLCRFKLRFGNRKI